MSSRITVTLGDPAGIGPEVVVKALADPSIASLARWLIVGDAAPLEAAERLTGLTLQQSEGLTVADPQLIQLGRVKPGTLSADCGRAALEYVRRATELCLHHEADAMVTAPVNKEAVTLSGQPFTGHTEFIAELCGVDDTRMLLASEQAVPWSTLLLGNLGIALCAGSANWLH